MLAKHIGYNNQHPRVHITYYCKSETKICTQLLIIRRLHNIHLDICVEWLSLSLSMCSLFSFFIVITFRMNCVLIRPSNTIQPGWPPSIHITMCFLCLCFHSIFVLWTVAAGGPQRERKPHSYCWTAERMMGCSIMEHVCHIQVINTPTAVFFFVRSNVGLYCSRRVWRRWMATTLLWFRDIYVGWKKTLSHRAIRSNNGAW